nr:transmembrane 9 superfamily member 1 [Quercus suber]
MALPPSLMPALGKSATPTLHPQNSCCWSCTSDTCTFDTATMLFNLPSGLALLLFSASSFTAAWYLPGITPTTYKANDLVPLHVNHLTPSSNDADEHVRSVFSFEYYHNAFHFCAPKEGAEAISESLGSIIFGDRIYTSPFELHMTQNETCKAVCDEVTFDAKDAKFVNRRILQDYNVNWLVDGLPAGQEYRDAGTETTFYQPGFSLGSIMDEKPMLNNHYDIFVDYHEVRQGQYRVVGILVEPVSLGGSTVGSDGKAACGTSDSPVVLDEKESTKVTWTYSVYWRPSKTSFATRWDKYLHVFDPKIHWFSLINSAIIFIVLAGMISTILLRTLRKDIARYNRLDQLGLDDLGANNAEDGIAEDSGWKLVHGDVFRAPKHSLALSVLVGNGAQLFMMAGFTIIFAVVGFLSPSNRGSVATVMILLYTIFGFIGGYVSARVYKSFGGKKWKQLFIYTPSIIPAIVFGTFFLLNLFVWARQSSGAVPFTTMLVLVGIWFVISAPLSVAGSWLGYRQEQPEPPTRTNQIPRQIPPARGYLRTVPSMLLVGVLPFGAIFVELYFIMNSLWSSRIYYMFGFLFLSFGLLIATSASVTILMIYFVLCAENYHWQWRAFASSGASAIYVFLYSLIYWAQMLSFSSFTGGLLYLGYSLLLSGLWFVLSGTIGFFASWIFIHRIYASLKID